MGKYFIVPVRDQATVELLKAVKEGKKSQTELVRMLRDYRKFKQALSVLDEIEIELRLAFGIYTRERINLDTHLLKRTRGKHNGRTRSFYEKNAYLDIIKIDIEKGVALIGFDEEALNGDG